MRVDAAGEPSRAVAAVLTSPQWASGLTTAAIGLAALSESIQRVIGWPGIGAAVAVLAVLCIASLIVGRSTLQWQGVLPISLLAFLAWACASIFWSQYQWSSFGGLAWLLGFTVMAVFIALSRDTIQIIRAFGDVLRFSLAASLVAEFVVGVLLDTSFPFLGIEGTLQSFGPIQGLFQTRNQLGLVAIIAAISFAIEFITRSVPRGLAIASLALSALCIALTGSPIVLGVLVATSIAATAMYWVRRVEPRRRTVVQLALLVLGVLGIVIVWVLRSRVVDAFSASGALNYRLSVWQQVWGLITVHPIEGWGWVGRWRPEVVPFPALHPQAGEVPGSALNAILDTWLQLGLVGAMILVGLVGLAFVRSWLLAGQRRSVAFTWPALVLMSLVIVSFFESAILVEFGWLTFVICCVKAARELSWRRIFDQPLPPDLEKA